MRPDLAWRAFIRCSSMAARFAGDACRPELAVCANDMETGMLFFARGLR